MPSDSTFTTIHSSIRDDQHPTMGEGASKTHSQIIKLLMERQHQLHSDISKLQEQHPQSTIAADNDMHHLNITTEQMVHEALLSTRLPLPFLNRTKLGPSTIDGAGRGLFATEDISEGEIITCYPCDALLYELPGNDDYNENEEDEGTESIVLWGAHVPKNDRWDEDAVFDGTESTPSLIAYAVSIGDHYSVMGHPDLDDNPAYYGHFVNDGAGHLALEETNSERNIQAALELGLGTPEDEDDEEMEVEDNIVAYILKSLEVSNAIQRPINEEEWHTVTVATRDIEANEEILVTYGPDYWLGHEIL